MLSSPVAPAEATVADKAAVHAPGELPTISYVPNGLDTVFIGSRVVAIVEGLDLEDIPEVSVSLPKSGKASVKAIPLGRRHELHREGICSTAVCVALEYLGILPVDEVEVVIRSCRLIWRSSWRRYQSRPTGKQLEQVENGQASDDAAKSVRKKLPILV